MNIRSGRPALYVLVGLLCYALFLLVNLPASTMHELLARFTDGHIAIQQPQGTFWNGTGDLIAHGGAGAPLRTRVTWSIQPLWLLTGRLQAQLHASGDADLQGTIRLGYRKLAVSNTEVTLPAEGASAFYAPLTLVSPTGRARISIERLELDAGGLRGRMLLTWENAGSRLSGLTDLGDYRMTVTGEGATAAILVETIRGEVKLNAKGDCQVTANGLVRLDGTIATGTREKALAPLMALIRARRNGDQYTFAATARLPTLKLPNN